MAFARSNMNNAMRRCQADAKLQSHLCVQVGGYLTQYNGLDFLTIRSSGHQVPTHKPQHAFVFFENWIANTLNATTATPDSFVLTNLFPQPEDQSTVSSSAGA